MTGFRTIINNTFIAAILCLCGITAILSFMHIPAVMAAELDCIWCHEELTKQAYVHSVVFMGCKTCHSGIDKRHKNTSGIKRGLFAKEPDICLGCHDKSAFTKKTVHSAINTLGCTGCHNPHSSSQKKLLKKQGNDLCYTCHEDAKFKRRTIHLPIHIGCMTCHNPHSTDNRSILVEKMPDLCFGCHDKSDFKGKNLHKPVADGKCARCHNPHSSNNMLLLRNEPNRLCIECHQRVVRKPHVIGSAQNGGHPLGGLTKNQKEDPARPGRLYYCGSCHNPHSSDSPSLFRFKAKIPSDICVNCHKF